MSNSCINDIATQYPTTDNILLQCLRKHYQLSKQLEKFKNNSKSTVRSHYIHSDQWTLQMTLLKTAALQGTSLLFKHFSRSNW